MYLFTPVEKLSGVGPVFQKKLKRMGIKTVEDLLWHLPSRYEDFSKLEPIAKVRPGEKCCVAGKILEIKTTRTWKRKVFVTQAVVEDESGAIKVVWFNQPYLTKTLKDGDRVCLTGKADWDKDGFYISSPAYEKIYDDNADLTHTGRIVPVYPETEGLSSRWLRFIIKPLLKQFQRVLPETLPLSVLKENNLMPIGKALEQAHFPDSLEEAEEAKKRFAFEELFFISLFVLRERSRLSNEKAATAPMNLALVQRFVKKLPFKLTDAQKKSAWQILKDLEKPRPMNRLLEGDVGSGKTVVAAIAGLNMAKAGYQTAFMAPTDILAKQHFQSLGKLLAVFGLNIGLLTGKTDKFISKKLPGEPIEISRKKLLEMTSKGEGIDILIGTQALIQDKVKFGNLALVVLDEQHRFGVAQRSKLVQTKREVQSYIPHLLSMTATPIPRTLALTIYGDLDISLLDELPKGRKKIITKIVAPSNRQKAYDFIGEQIERGRQAFVICPRIEKSQISNSKATSWAEVKAVKEEYEKLSKEIFPELNVEMLHGQLGVKEKEKIMKDFSRGKIDVLVSTSVIEVGIDIPNASVMMIEGADRFGLAQLHQFRGRVGRGEHQSFCFLFTDSSAKKTSQRLAALVNTEDGFKLAEKDLIIRGPGDFFGVRQWGIPDMAMASLTDLKLVEKTREAAKELLTSDPFLKNYPLLYQRVEKFRQRVHLE